MITEKIKKGGMFGKKHSEETKRKISLATKGKNLGQIPWNKGKHLSKKIREKISIANKGKHREWIGKKHSLETLKKMSETHKKNGTGKWNKGKKQSEEWKKKRADAHRGKLSWNWKGGITPLNTKIRFSPEYRLWLKKCMERDNFTCQKCNVCNGFGKTIILQIHHIINFSDYPELRFAIDNGITFCKLCHKVFHTEYGIKNNTEEQLKTFLKQNK